VLIDIPPNLDPDSFVSDERFDPSILAKFTPGARQVFAKAIARRDAPKEKSWSDKAWDLGKDTTEAALRIVPAVAGSIVGATGGAAGGATVGTSIPVLGTVAGGVYGGIAGGMAGGSAGAAAGEGLAQKFHNWAYDIPEQDLNLNQVGLAAFLGLIPGSRVASPALKAAMALPVLRQGVEAAARSGGAQAVERFLASKGATAAAKSVASWAGYGAADSIVMDTVSRAAQGQPQQTLGGRLETAAIGAAVGGGFRAGGMAASSDKGKRLLAQSARKLGTATAGAVTGYQAGKSTGIPYAAPIGAVIGGISGGKTAKYLDKSYLKGRLRDILDLKDPNVALPSTLDIVNDAERLAKSLSDVQVLGPRQVDAAKNFASVLEEADKNSVPVTDNFRLQAARVAEADNSFSVNNILPRMGKIVQEVIDDPAYAGDMSLLTDKQILQLNKELTDGLDRMSRAGMTIPEDLRQVYEGVRERIAVKYTTEHADALSVLNAASNRGEQALKDAIAELRSTKKGAETFGKIQRDDNNVLASITAHASNVGGRLNQGKVPPPNALLDILEDMREPSIVDARNAESVSVLGPDPTGGTSTIPTNVEIKRFPGAAVSVSATPKRNVAERARERGADPVVQSSVTLTPSQIEAAIRERPGIQVVLDIKELERRGQVVRPHDPVLERFKRGFELLTGRSPVWDPGGSSKDYGVNSVMGQYYSGGKNEVSDAEKAIRQRILTQILASLSKK
jgi:hypothetical protein